MNNRRKKASWLMDKRAVDVQIASLCVINLSLKILRMRRHLTLNANQMSRLVSRSDLTAPRALPRARRQKAILIWN